VAIKFTFTLNDLDAQNLFLCIQDAIRRFDDGILEEMSGAGHKSQIDWYNGHKRYVKEIMSIMVAEQHKLPDSILYETKTGLEEIAEGKT
jgi:hypothetical protein